MAPGGPEGGASHTTGPITTRSSEMSDLWGKAFQALLEQANVPSAWVWEPSPLIYPEGSNGNTRMAHGF